MYPFPSLSWIAVLSGLEKMLAHSRRLTAVQYREIISGHAPSMSLFVDAEWIEGSCSRTSGDERGQCFPPPETSGGAMSTEWMSIVCWACSHTINLNLKWIHTHRKSRPSPNDRGMGNEARALTLGLPVFRAIHRRSFGVYYISGVRWPHDTGHDDVSIQVLLRWLGPTVPPWRSAEGGFDGNHEVP